MTQSLLQAIERRPYQHWCREDVYGYDHWHCYEFSWLSTLGIPRYCYLDLKINAQSTYLVESKSLKFYLNSFNDLPFDDHQIVTTIQNDISNTLEEQVEVSLSPLNSFKWKKLLPGLCVDNLSVEELQVTSELLSDYHHQKISRLELLLPVNAKITDAHLKQTYVFYSHVFRSVCPLSGQPDWATVVIELDNYYVLNSHLLAYLLSYRNHGDFHESCIEGIFADLKQALNPSFLSVQAFFNRRGGIDICPFRASQPSAKSAINNFFR